MTRKAHPEPVRLRQRTLSHIQPSKRREIPVKVNVARNNKLYYATWGYVAGIGTSLILIMVLLPIPKPVSTPPTVVKYESPIHIKVERPKDLDAILPAIRKMKSE